MDRQEAARLLGVQPDSTPDVAQHAYVRLVRHTHPDTMPTATGRELAEAAARFDLLVQARDTLAEPAPPPAVPDSATPGPPRRRHGSGVSLVVLAIAVFAVLAVISLGDAFHLFHVGPLIP